MKGESRSARKRATRAQAKADAKAAEPATIEPATQIEQTPAPKPKRMSRADTDALIQRELMKTSFGRIASIILSS